MSKALFRSIYGSPFPAKELRFRSTKKVNPRKWSSNPGRMKGNREAVRKFTLDLLSIEGKLYDAYNAIRNERIPTVTTPKN